MTNEPTAATPAPTAQPAIAAPATTVKLVQFQNVSEVALPIPELNMIVPKGGFSAPLPEATPTLAAYVKGGLFTANPVQIPELTGASVRAVVQGDSNTEIDTKGAAQPLVADPNTQRPPDQHTVKGPDYTPFKVSTPQERLKGYDNQAAVRDVVSNTVVSIGSDSNPINQFGEIPADEAARLVRANGAASFSTEVSGGQYVADEAQKIIASASGVVATPTTPKYPIPEGVPAEILPFFQRSLLQKKIFIYKTTDVDTLHRVQGFEKDPNVLSCIEQRMAELGK